MPSNISNLSEDEKFDFFFVILGAILGILSGALIGVPLWFATGIFDYFRLFFFLGITIGGLIGTGVTERSRSRRRKRG